jgi:hypothetical protein
MGMVPVCIRTPITEGADCNPSRVGEMGPQADRSHQRTPVGEITPHAATGDETQPTVPICRVARLEPPSTIKHVGPGYSGAGPDLSIPAFTAIATAHFRPLGRR